jgi:hypothetical protein
MSKKNWFVLVLLAVFGLATMSGGCGGGGGGGGGGGDDGGGGGGSSFANAGPDFIVGKGHKAVLDGSGSVGADSYEWTQTEGPEEVEISNPRAASPYFRSYKEGVYKLTLTAKRGGETASDEVTVTVQAAPYVNVLEPSVAKTRTVNEPQVDFSGYVSKHVVSVALKNAATGQTAEGEIQPPVSVSAEFAIPSVNMAKGDNAITVTATDDLGQIATETFIITYNSTVEFIKGLSSERRSIKLNIPMDIAFTLEIYEHNGRRVPDSFDLYEVSEAGANIAKVGTLQKDASEEGVYGGSFTLTKSALGKCYYRAECFEDGEFQRSRVIEMSVIPNYTWEEAKASFELAYRIFDEMFPDDVIGENYFDAVENIEKYIDALNKRPEIERAELNGYADYISVVFKNGASAVYPITWDESMFKEFEKSADVTKDSRTSSADAPLPPQFMRGLSYPPFMYIGSKTIALLSPYQAEFSQDTGNGDVNDGIRRLFNTKNSTLTPPFEFKMDKKNDEISMDDWRSGLNGCGVVSISTHARVGYGTMILWSGISAENPSETDIQDADDGLMKMMPNEIMVRYEVNGKAVYRKEKAQTYAIYPDFFDKYFRGDNSLVFIGGCEALDGDIQEVLIRKGAGAVVSYSKEQSSLIPHTTVGRVWKTGNKFFEHMLDGDTVLDAYIKTYEAHKPNNIECAP